MNPTTEETTTDGRSTTTEPDTTTLPSTISTIGVTSPTTTTTTTAKTSSVETSFSTSASTVSTSFSTSYATASTFAVSSSHVVSTTPHHKGSTMDAGTGVGVAIGAAILFLACVLIFYYLRRTGRLKCLYLKKIRNRPRRSSTSSSRRVLEPYDNESLDTMPRLTDGDMFAIADQEDPDVGADDGYYYDEVFGSSGFEDETTKASNKELFSTSSEPDIPDLLLRVDNLS